MKLFKKLAFGNCVQPSVFNPGQQETPLVDLVGKLKQFLLYLESLVAVNRPADQYHKKACFSHQTSTVAFKRIPAAYWMPIIKSTTPINYCHADNHRADLAGLSVLCVDGRKKHYARYYQSTKAMNGKLVVFRSDAEQSLSQLQREIEVSDLIICPIDCINHEAFLMVKYYCKYFGKPCVLLDQSLPDTFKKGLEALTCMLPVVTEKLPN